MTLRGNLYGGKDPLRLGVMTKLCGDKHRTNFLVPLALDLEWEARCVLCEYENTQEESVPEHSSVAQVMRLIKELKRLRQEYIEHKENTFP